ncbi:MAG: hypothetical protein LBQ60_17630 [Bacteroidales bacterium]|jgi:hypothetical protein|nr:hypothetical protein [Bacteroidales bacterium]
MKYSLIFISFIIVMLWGCRSHAGPEGYFVRPCEFICDYPFNDTTKWAITCRVWGLLKYYHPNVTAGKLDWDKVLLDRMVDINYSSTPEMVNVELAKMLVAAGEYTGKKDNDWNDSLNMNMNLCWLDNSFLDKTLINELKKIASLTVKFPAYYRIDYENPMLPNEKGYKVDINTSYKHRLLSLFRYWNVIYYFFPHKYLMDQSWDKTLTMSIFPFIHAADIQSYQIAFLKLAAALNDGHGYISFANYYRAEALNTIEMIDGQTVITVDAGGLLPGDIIDVIQGRNINHIRDSLSVLIPASTQLNKEFRINSYVAEIIFFNKPDIVISRNGQPIKIQMPFVDFEKQKPGLYRWISDDIAYVDFSVLTKQGIDSVFHALSNVTCIIFDIRKGVDQSYDAELFGGYLSNKNTRLFPTVLPHPEHPGAFVLIDDFQASSKDTRGRRLYKGKIVYLIDENTQSATETVAFVGRTNYQAILIGRPTSGALGRVTWIPLPGNQRAAFSNFGLFSLDGTEFQRKGIIPDIEVYPTMESVREGKDEILEAAIEYLNTQ